MDAQHLNAQLDHMARTLNDFQRLMVRLDGALTGTTVPEIVQQMHHKPGTPVEWFTRDREWYLSDGGYSRVYIDAYDGHLFVGGQSTPRVKAAWQHAGGIVAQVEQMVRRALQDAGEIL